MTPAEFDTRRRLVGLSIQEAADWCGVQRRTVERWISGYSEVSHEACNRLVDLETRMATAVGHALELAQSKSPDVVEIKRYRSQAAVDASPYAAGLPLGAHAILIGWTMQALRSSGLRTAVIWGDDTP